MVEVAVATVAAFSVISVPQSSVVPAAKAVVAASATASTRTTTAAAAAAAAAHASMEAFGALMAEALARPHGAPAIAFVVLVATPPEAIVSGIPPVPAKPITGTLRVVSAAKVEAIAAILSLRVPQPPVGVARSAVARRRGGRKAGPRGAEDYVIWVWWWLCWSAEGN